MPWHVGRCSTMWVPLPPTWVCKHVLRFVMGITWLQFVFTSAYLQMHFALICIFIVWTVVCKLVYWCVCLCASMTFALVWTVAYTASVYTQRILRGCVGGWVLHVEWVCGMKCVFCAALEGGGMCFWEMRSLWLCVYEGRVDQHCGIKLSV